MSSTMEHAMVDCMSGWQQAHLVVRQQQHIKRSEIPVSNTAWA
jgi:hypothetical protein